MLSIIISSYKPILFAALEKNIAETCGVAYEIIKIDNPGLMGICEAYNKGAQKAKFESLLFLHEDVKFHSQNWGLNLQKYYELSDLGVLGVAGCTRKFHLPYGFDSGLYREGKMFVNHSNYEKVTFIQPQFPLKVKVIDGVLIGMKRKVWQELPFNSDKIKGFHFYDLDISLRASERYQNYLATDLDIEHFSEGNFGDRWIEACIAFNRLSGYDYDNVRPKEQRDIRNFWYKKLIREHISLRNRLRYAFMLGTNKDTFSSFINFILKNEE